MINNTPMSKNIHEGMQTTNQYQMGIVHRRNELVDVITKVEDYVNDAFDRFKGNLDNYDGSKGQDFLMDRDLEILRHYVDTYGETSLRGVNSKTLQLSQENLAVKREERDISYAEEDIKTLRTNIEHNVAGKSKIPMERLKLFIKNNGEGCITGITTQTLSEIQKKIDLVEASDVLNEAMDDLNEGRRFMLQNKVKHLKEIVSKSGERAVPGLNYDTLHTIAIKSTNIFGRSQKGIVKSASEDGTVVITPNNGDLDLIIKNSRTKCVEGEMVEFVINSPSNIAINKNI